MLTSNYRIVPSGHGKYEIEQEVYASGFRSVFFGIFKKKLEVTRWIGTGPVCSSFEEAQSWIDDLHDFNVRKTAERAKAEFRKKNEAPISYIPRKK